MFCDKTRCQNGTTKKDKTKNLHFHFVSKTKFAHKFLPRLINSTNNRSQKITTVTDLHFSFFDLSLFLIRNDTYKSTVGCPSSTDPSIRTEKACTFVVRTPWFLPLKNGELLARSPVLTPVLRLGYEFRVHARRHQRHRPRSCCHRGLSDLSSCATVVAVSFFADLLCLSELCSGVLRWPPPTAGSSPRQFPSKPYATYVCRYPLPEDQQTGSATMHVVNVGCCVRQMN